MAKWQHIAAVIVGCGVLVFLLAQWIEVRNQPPDLALNEEVSLEDFQAPLTPEEQEIRNPEIVFEENPVATISTNFGDIEIELFGDTMPVTVNNFVQLAESGAYDSTIFHRVIEGFMIQGGDVTTRTDGEAPAQVSTIPDEFVTGELLTNTRGTIAMANTGQPNSGSSQWFINLGNNKGLDFNNNALPQSRHPVFGRVISGMEVVDTIAAVEKEPNARGEIAVPVEPVIINSVTIN